MTMGPLTVQGGIQNSAEIHRSQRVDPRQEGDAQRHFASQLNKQAQQQEQTVVTASKAENPNINRDARGKGYGGSSGKRNQDGKKQRESAHAQDEGGMLDVLG